jgi:hypothetical protein
MRSRYSERLESIAGAQQVREGHATQKAASPFWHAKTFVQVKWGFRLSHNCAIEPVFTAKTDLLDRLLY